MTSATSLSDFKTNHLVPTAQNSDSNTDTCPIHRGPYCASDPPVCITSCNHTFGRTCLLTWLESSNTCPLCRRTLFPCPAEVPPRDLRIVVTMPLPARTARLVVTHNGTETQDLREQELQEVRYRLERAWDLWIGFRSNMYVGCVGVLTVETWSTGILVFGNERVEERDYGSSWEGWEPTRNAVWGAFETWAGELGVNSLPGELSGLERRNGMEIERDGVVGEDVEIVLQMVSGLPQLLENFEDSHASDGHEHSNLAMSDHNPLVDQAPEEYFDVRGNRITDSGSGSNSTFMTDSMDGPAVDGAGDSQEQWKDFNWSAKDMDGSSREIVSGHQSSDESSTIAEWDGGYGDYGSDRDSPPYLNPTPTLASSITDTTLDGAAIEVAAPKKRRRRNMFKGMKKKAAGRLVRWVGLSLKL
jgi:hypothetical protein